jgi:hypothetical protein
MYASKRTIGKQGVWGAAPVNTKKRTFKHGNRANSRGRKVYAQLVVDKDGKTVRTVYHYTGMDIFNIKRKKSRLRKSMEKQPR